MASSDHPSYPTPRQGKNGPGDSRRPHPDTGNNRSPGTGKEGNAQWKPGEKG